MRGRAGVVGVALCANARKLRAISASHTKNDAEDARMLARLGRANPALLSPIKHRSEQGQRALLRIKVRAIDAATPSAYGSLTIREHAKGRGTKNSKLVNHFIHYLRHAFSWKARRAWLI